MALKELFVLFTADTKDVDTKIQKLNKQFKDTTKELNRISDGFRSFGRSASLFLTTPILGLATAGTFAKAEMEGLEATLTSVLKKFDQGIPISQAVQNEMQFLKDTAEELGISLQSIQKPYIKYMAASKDSLEDTRKVAKAFISLGSALQITSPDLNRVIRAIEQMQSKTKIMAEELKLQLGDTMPGAISLFSKAMGVTEADFLKLMERGEVSSDLLKKVSDVIQTDYKEAIEMGSKSTRGNLNRLATAFFLLRKSIGGASEQVFNINENLGKLAGWLVNTSKDLDMLNDSGKKTLFWLGAFLIAIGPISFAVGLLIRGIAIARSGFLALLIPITFLRKKLYGLSVIYRWFRTNALLFRFASIYALIRAFKLLMSVIRLSPFGLLLTASYELYKNWDKLLNIFTKAKDALKEFLGLSEDKKDISQELKLERTLNPQLTQNALDAFGVNQTKIPQQSMVNNNTVNIQIPQGTSSKDRDVIRQSVIDGLKQSAVNDLFQVRLQE